MRFMMIVKTAENSGRPLKESMEAISKLSGEAVKAGTMIGAVDSAQPRWEPVSGFPVGRSQ